jgi:ribonuclease P protein component
LGLAISRRAVARAVDRNRIKRVVRESFRSNASAIGSLDIVVRAAPTARTQSNALLSRKLNDLWRKIKNNTQNIRT